MPNNQLFAFYIGGSHPKSNIELHNLQFAVGGKISDCFEQLKNDWFGDLDGVHIDSYIMLDYVDGYKISINDKKDSKENSDLKLFCVHLGAKVENVFEEQHKTQFIVSRSANEALLKVVKSINDPTWEDVHRDLLYDVESVIDLSEKYNLEITQTETDQTYRVVNFYKKI